MGSLYGRRGKTKTAVYERLNEEVSDNLPPLTHQQTAYLAFQFCILWFIANYASNVSLAYTNVPSFTILSSMSGIFTLLFAALVKIENFTWLKLGSLLLSIAGVVIVSVLDMQAGDDDGRVSINALVWGDLLALLGAIFYALYTTLMKLRIGHERRIQMTLFFGYVGAFNTLCLWPGLLMLSWLGIEPIGWPSRADIIWTLLLNACLTVVSELLWILAMLMTSPLIVTVGLSLAIPMSVVAELLVNRGHGSPLYYVGASMVVVAFMGVNWEG